MKILILCPSFFPIRGGAEQTVYELASRLKADNTVVIVTLRWDKSFKRRETVGGLEVHRVGFLRFKGVNLLSKCLSLFFKMTALFRKYRFDVIHMFQVFETGCAAYLFRKAFRVPLLISLVGWDTYDPHIKLAKRHLFLIRKVMNASSLVTAPSRFQAEAANKQGYRRDIVLVPLGSSMHDRVDRAHPDLKKGLHLEGKKIVLSVQRLHPRKGLEDLLAAIPAILAGQKDAHFILVGEGPEEKRLKSQARALGIEAHLTFTGFVPDDDLPSYYAAADLFVLPTLYESFGLVYADALSFGVPVVTTETSGALDIIEARNGILVPVKDPEKLGRAVVEALHKPWDKKAIRESAERFRWDHLVEKYKELYTSIISA